jgi:hypothetical protein
MTTETRLHLTAVRDVARWHGHQRLDNAEPVDMTGTMMPEVILHDSLG